MLDHRIPRRLEWRPRSWCPSTAGQSSVAAVNRDVPRIAPARPSSRTRTLRLVAFESPNRLRLINLNGRVG
jgi:hypothetical protein